MRLSTQIKKMCDKYFGEKMLSLNKMYYLVETNIYFKLRFTDFNKLLNVKQVLFEIFSAQFN